MKSFKVNVNPDIIKWSLESINMSEDVFINKMGINKNKFMEWLNRTNTPTYVQLQKLAKIVNVSPLIFLSDKTPEDKPMNVFRTYVNTREKSYKTLLKIKRISYLQNVANDLYTNLNISEEPNVEKYTVNSDPRRIAINERQKFFDLDVQSKLNSNYDALSKFRSKVEDSNMIVMQFPFDDIRGFSLIGKKPFFIVLNSRESPESRIFTLFHEYAHILLGQNESNDDNYNNSNDKIEEWCNNFASYFLISDELINQYYNQSKSIEKIARTIASRYKVSYSMIYYRLYKLGYVQDFEDKYNNLANIKELDNKKPSGGNYIRKIKSEYGNKFIKIVYESYESNEITLDDALTYLGIKINTFDKLIEMVNQ